MASFASKHYETCSHLTCFDAENVVLSSSKVYHYESEMPGDNCSVFGYGSCRRTKGIGIWKLPSARNAEYKKWREEWLSAITKTRVMDEDLKKTDRQ